MSTVSGNENAKGTSGTAEDGAPRVNSGGVSPSPQDSSRGQSLLPSIKFNKQLGAMSQKAQSKPELVRNIAALLKAAGCRALWIVPRDGRQCSDPISLLGDDAELLDILDNSLDTTTSLVENSRSLISFEPGSLKGNVLLGAPVISGELVTDILIGLYPAAGKPPVPADWTFHIAADSISKWQMRRFVRSTRHQLFSLSSFVNMAAAMNRTENQLDAAITLVNELKMATSAGHVALMLRKNRKSPFRLAAMSGVEFFDRNAATTQTIESTILGMEERPVFWSMSASESEDNVELQINLQNYCNLFEAEGCALLPLRDPEDRLFGWLLISLTPDQCGSPQAEKHFRQITALVAGQMSTVLKSQRSITNVCFDNARQLVKKNLTRKIAAAVAIACLVLCIPFAYKIPCSCQLQLTSRRFVAAPYEGLLEKTLVESGDIVIQGQPLARMDASELRMQLSGLQADLHSERKKRDSALARGSVAESQIAGSEMNRLESEISILSQQLKDTETRSPIAGVIISGDLDKAQGAPMEMGQNLFEVGPLEQMLVEIHIPDTEIQYVSTGMTVRFEFDAFPFESFAGTIERIHPRAEVIDNASVFVAEINLDNSSGQLRPGLKGRAKIQGQRYPLGWNLFHGAFEKARQWLIW